MNVDVSNIIEYFLHTGIKVIHLFTYVICQLLKNQIFPNLRVLLNMGIRRRAESFYEWIYNDSDFAW